jgi:hypothetical protein
MIKLTILVFVALEVVVGRLAVPVPSNAPPVISSVMKR